jgi:DNA repair protein RecO (recombination protein O)
MSDQLGSFRGELIHATAASVMDDPLALAMLSAVCAESEDALPEREPHEPVFAGLILLTVFDDTDSTHLPLIKFR